MFSLDGMAGTKSIPNINAAMNTNSMNPKATGLKGPLLNYKNWLTYFLYHFGFCIFIVITIIPIIRNIKGEWRGCYWA